MLTDRIGNFIFQFPVEILSLDISGTENPNIIRTELVFDERIQCTENFRLIQHTSSVIHNQLDFKDFDFHSLRHTHTTMLIENGAPPVYVQNRLGHKNLDTTMNIYANHMTETFKQQGNSILNNMY